jgi:hypothetical protein
MHVCYIFYIREKSYTMGSMTVDRKRMRNHRKPPEVVSASPTSYQPTIGRLVLNSEALSPALAYLKAHAARFFEELPFVQLVTRGHYKKLGRTDAQHILATLPEYPGYRPEDFDSTLDCRIIRPRDQIREYGTMRCSYFLLQVAEVRDQNRLRDDRTVLLNHMGEDPVPPRELAKGFRIPLASIAKYEGTVTELQDGFMPLLPEVVTLGPVQLEPSPPAQ